MALDLKTGERLPFFRLATMGGTSRSRDDFLGRPALFFGWASWDVSRESLPALQKFHEANRGRIAVVAIAFDVQGPEHPMRYLRAAGFTFTALIDATCELSRQWGATSVPLVVATDADSVVRVTGERLHDELLSDVLPALERNLQKAPPDRPREHKFVKFEVLLQSCTNLLGRSRREEALMELQQAMQLDPSNLLIRRQMWAIAHPERFYSGPIDLDWQKVQEEATRSMKTPRKQKR